MIAWRSGLVLLAIVLFPLTLRGQDQYDFTIYVAFDDATLTLVDNTRGRIVRVFKIAVPSTTPSRLPREAYVAGIDTDPVWVPTDKTIEARARQKIYLKARYESYRVDPANPLGLFRINLTFTRNDPKLPIKIHGTNKPEYVRSGAHVSRGCIRMLNSMEEHGEPGIAELVNLIQEHSVYVIFDRKGPSL